MRKLELLTAEQLLSISSAERLFSRSEAEAKTEYRTLVHLWHPDTAGKSEAQRVLSHIVELYKQATLKLSTGTWKEVAERIDEETQGIRKFRVRRSNRILTISYRAARSFELGAMLIDDGHVAFVIDREFDDLFERGARQIRALRYRDEQMAVEMAKYLPQIQASVETEDSNVLIVRKTPDQILLADLVAHLGGTITDVKHVGWIVNGLLNIACYLEWFGLTHNAISLDNVFISPLRHSMMLLGGWWYSTPAGGDLVALPERSLRVIPPDIIGFRRADIRSDLELIKVLGRELLGESFDSLRCEAIDIPGNVPSGLVNWLGMSSSGDALQDYASWKYEVLPQCFGIPTFVGLDINPSDIYKEA